jgi:outer membrane protein assembly factor BamB
VLAGVAALAVVVLLGVAALYWFRRETPVAFTALESAGISVPFGGGSIERTTSSTIGDRAYVSWQDDRGLRVAAIDLATRRKLWEVAAPSGPTRWEGIAATARAVLVFAGESSDSTARPVYALSPDDGRQLWQVAGHGGDRRYLFDAMLVIDSRYDTAVRAYDWATGDQKWHVDARAGSSGQLTTVAYAAPGESDPADSAPSTFWGYPFPSWKASDARLVLLDSERVLTVVDLATGKRRERPNVASYDEPVYALGDRLYALVKGQLWEYDLGKLGEPRVLYTLTADNKRFVGAPERCGDGLICLLERSGSDAKSTELVAVDVEDRTVARRRPAPGTERLMAVGDNILARAYGSAPASAFFDSGGKQLLRDDDRGTVAVRLDRSSLLLFSKPPSDYGETVALTGVTAGGDRKPLGSIEGVRSASCSYNTTYLVCATNREFRVWRFAE